MRRLGRVAMIATTAVVLGGPAMPDGDVVTARQAAMSYIGSNMRTLGAMARDAGQFDARYVKAFGNAAAVIAQSMPILFAAGTDGLPGSDATPALTDDRAAFLAKISQFEGDARSLAGQTDHAGFGKAFQAFAANCKSCHSVHKY